MKTKIFPSWLRLTAVLILLLAAVRPVQPALAGTCTVTSNLDDDTTYGTLRAVLAYSSCDMIDFAGDMTIYLANTLTISRNLTIDGAGHNVTVSGDTGGDGTANVQVFRFSPNVTATLKNLTVTKGYTEDWYGGGAIFNQGNLTVSNCSFIDNSAGGSAGGIGGAISHYIAVSGGQMLTVSSSTFSGNSATYGGGAIYSYGMAANVSGSTFSGNSAGSVAGAIYFHSGYMNVQNSTFSGNSATSGGGGAIYAAYQGVVNVTNSTFSGNSSGTAYGASIGNTYNVTIKNSILVKGESGPNCSGNAPLADSTTNLADDDSCGASFTNSPSINLGTLGNYGGSTATIPLLDGSTAIDAGDDAVCAVAPVNNLDQRGVTRPQGAHCDIGAFEKVAGVLTKTGGDSQSTSITTAFPTALQVRVSDASGAGVSTTVTFTAPTEGASATFDGSSSATVATDSNGYASVVALANDTPGAYAVTVTSAYVPASVEFTLVNLSNGGSPITATYVDDGYDSGTPGWNVDHFASIQSGVDAVSDGGTITVYPGTYTENVTLNNHAELSLEGDITLDGSLVLATGSFHAASYTLLLSGDFTNIASFDAGTGKVILNGSGVQTIGGSGVTTFNDLTINNTSDLNPAVKLKTDATVNGTLDLQAGALGVYAENFTLNGPVINGGGSMAGLLPTTTYAMAASDQNVAPGQYGNLAFNDQSKTLPDGVAVNIRGKFDPGQAGSHTVAGSTVAFNGEGVQTIANNMNFNNLTVGDGVMLVTSSDVSVSGLLTNNGETKETKTVGGASPFAFGLSGISVDVTTQGSLTALTVVRHDQDHPQAADLLKTGRYWTITPEGSGYTVNLTLPHDGLADPYVSRFLDPGWGWGRDSFTSSTVTRNGITELSDWAVSNGSPVVIEISADAGGPYLGAINTAIQFDGSLSSGPDGYALTYAWDFGDGSNGTGMMPTHAYAAAGVYNVCLTVNDGTVNSATACTLAVVYDPSAGFVTGGGWIDSPAGAYKPDESLSGKAAFGFVSKYKKGAPVPTGTTQFRFDVADFSFYSETYEWLVVSKYQVTAQFKGSGTVNGALDPNGNAYKFMLWAGDGTPDTFRIRIWWEDADGVEHDVYDNGFEQAISGGSIVVHTGK